MPNLFKSLICAIIIYSPTNVCKYCNIKLPDEEFSLIFKVVILENDVESPPPAVKLIVPLFLPPAKLV